MSSPPTDNAAAALPESLRGLFWDVRFEDVSLGEHRDYVIERIMTRGTWDDMQWLRRTVGDDAVRAWILRTEGQLLDAKALSFWRLILELPAGEVDRWLANPERKLWIDRNL